jgi:hypothetical protein
VVNSKENVQTPEDLSQGSSTKSQVLDPSQSTNANIASQSDDSMLDVSRENVKENSYVALTSSERL